MQKHALWTKCVSCSVTVKCDDQRGWPSRVKIVLVPARPVAGSMSLCVTATQSAKKCVNCSRLLHSDNANHIRSQTGQLGSPYVWRSLWYLCACGRGNVQITVGILGCRDTCGRTAAIPGLRKSELKWSMAVHRTLTLTLETSAGDCQPVRYSAWGWGHVKWSIGTCPLATLQYWSAPSLV